MIEGLVASSVRYRWIVIALIAAMTVASVGVAVHLFRINTDVERLIDPKEPWRLERDRLREGLPAAVEPARRRDRRTDAGGDGRGGRRAHPRPLRAEKKNSSRRSTPAGGPFFDKNGLLLMPQAELDKTLDQLTQQQGLLGPLAADPSLRGVMRVLTARRPRREIRRRHARSARQADGADRRHAAEGVEGRAGRFPAVTPRQRRDPRHDKLKFVMIQPVLDFNALEPGYEATKMIREVARDLKIEAANGLRMRLTGTVAVADEEFANALPRMRCSTTASSSAPSCCSCGSPCAPGRWSSPSSSRLSPG